MQDRARLLYGLLLLALPFSANAAGEKVGTLGGPRNFAITGNSVVPSDVIRRELLADPDVIIAGHPLAPLATFLETVRERLWTGYRFSGFKDPKISVVAEPDQVRVQIVEGERLLAGPVEIRGAKLINTNLLIRRLTESYPPRSELRVNLGNGNYLDAQGNSVTVQEPSWKIGQPAPFDTESAIETRAELIFKDLGFLRARAQAEIETPPFEKNARLVITVTSEGRPAKLTAIEVSGNARNSTAEILQYLKLTPGTALNQELAKSASHALFLSGRFPTNSVEIVPDQDGNGSLQIHLRENKLVSPLGQALDRTEQVMMNLRNWLDRTINDGGSLAAAMIEPSFGVTAVISRREGLLLKFSPGTSTNSPRFMPAVFVSSNAAGIFIPARQQKYFAEQPRQVPAATVRLLPDENDDTQGHIELSASLRTRHHSEDPAYVMEIELAPSAFLAIAHKTPSTPDRFTNGIFERGGGTNLLLRIEERTGKLLAVDAPPPGSISIRAGGAELIGGFLNETKSWANEYVSDQAASTFFSIASRALLPLLASMNALGTNISSIAPALAAADKLLTREAFAFLDPLLNPPAATDAFTIPASVDGTNPQSDMAAVVAGYIYRYLDEMLPPGSWPSVAVREVVFATRGHTEYLDAELDRLYSDPRMGSLGYYTIARLLAQIQHPRARPFALRGMTRLSAEDFRRDYRLLMSDTTIFGKLLQNARPHGAALTTEEVESLSQFSPALGAIARGISVLAKTSGQDLSDALSPLLDSLWEKQWRAELRDALRSLME